ncbi:MAG: DUF4190 domain-containing protein [Chloroflexi bacterium]|nr:DUF4190 domain-containing protein [Anaerolineaceae bacterium]NMB87303.1 DUF4190 domain-containing protein [Chloroflexota bacterium]
MTTPEYETQSYTPSPGLPTSSNAIISLICGVLAWLGIFGLGGILAVIFGHIAKNEIRASNGVMGGDGLATAGLVLGYANIAIAVLGFCLFFLILAGIISSPLVCLPFMNGVNTQFGYLP